MTAMFDKLTQYLAFDFTKNALIVGVLIALCSSLLGVILVLKRYSFIGDGLSHVAFGSLAIAGVLNFTNEMPTILIITIFASILLLGGTKKKLSGDASLAIISVASLGLGYLLMNIFARNRPNLSGDVCTVLFGSTSILTLSKSDVIISSVLSVLVVLFFVFFYNRIFAITFDEDFSRSCGVKVKLYNYSVAVIIAVIVVLSMNLVGSLLSSALIIFPALTAMRVFKTFKSVTIAAALISVFTATLGILAAIVFGTPVGSTIVAVETVGFLIFTVIGAIA
ncbi:MAG TPA: metal ABC transporter permease [Clostridiales bacterium]|nr:metal ABC transporter permease [Clostridiales bacterium]